jgi:uncharacterized protein (TIGR00255 family)
MTGYAQAQGQNGSWNVTITIRSLNHRYLDLHFRLPTELDPAELRLKKTTRAHARRGHLEVQARLERAGGRGLQVDRELIGSVLKTYEEIRKEHGVATEPDLTAVLRMPGIFRQGADDLSSEESQMLADLADKTLIEALGKLNQMRGIEGAALEKELRERVGRIVEARDELVKLCEAALPARQKQLKEKLLDLLGDDTLDPVRLAEEAAYRAERADVSEELTRLQSHTGQFETILGEGNEAGKRLDFLLQEMNRETNTVLSKTPGLGEDGLEMTRLGLAMKAEIERLREQVQNVE